MKSADLKDIKKIKAQINLNYVSRLITYYFFSFKWRVFVSSTIVAYYVDDRKMFQFTPMTLDLGDKGQGNGQICLKSVLQLLTRIPFSFLD